MHTLAEFLERGYLTAHLGRTLPEYRQRVDAMEETLQQHGLNLRGGSSNGLNGPEA